VQSAEHAYQAQKTLDHGAREEILAAPTPGQAKRLGSKVELRPGWEEIKIEVMRQIIAAKFASATEEVRLPLLSGLLMATGGKHLVEGNTWGDTFWGCVHPTEGSNLWVGRNQLGILLMERRRVLQHEICL
jgi:ribA/ribD-fused uncharacterized protein